MFGFDDSIKSAKKVWADFQQVEKAINEATEAHLSAETELQVSVEQLQQAVAKEILEESSATTVADARKLVERRKQAVAQVAERLSALRGRLASVAEQMGQALPGLHERVPAETAELQEQVIEQYAKALLSLRALTGKRKLLERVLERPVEIAEPEAPEPQMLDTMPARHFSDTFRAVLSGLAGDGEPRGLLAGGTPEMLARVQAAQAATAELAREDQLERDREYRARVKAAVAAAPKPRPGSWHFNA